MTNQHPITPPPEMVKQWLCSDDYLWGPIEQTSMTITANRLQNVAAQAAQWGADQELEACCKWTAIVGGAEALRAARRPKPPSLKEQALSDLKNAYNADQICDTTYENIFRALEAPPDD
jgi:hypothetical protein